MFPVEQGWALFCLPGDWGAQDSKTRTADIEPMRHAGLCMTRFPDGHPLSLGRHL